VRCEQALADHGGELALAAINGPENFVVSGRAEPLARLCARLEADGVRCRPLPVARGFHSPLMAPMLPDLERAADRIAYRPSRIPVISNVTALPLSSAAVNGAYWRAHAAAPVRFADGVSALVDAGANAFIEVGPTATLLGLVQQVIAGDRQPLLLPSLRKGKDDLEVALDSLAALYVAGADVRWDSFDAGFGRQRVEIPGYPFQRRRYWMFADTAGPANGNAASLSAAPAIAAPQADDGEPETDGDAAGARAALRAELGSCPPEQRTRRAVAAIRELTAAVLGLAPSDVELDVPLQALGLDSLIAVQLRHRIYRGFGVTLALVGFLSSPSVTSLAQQVLAQLHDEPGGDAAPETPAAALGTVALDPGAAHEPFGLTDLQQAYLLGRSGTFELGNVSTCFLFEVEVSGLDVARLETALARLIERHDMLRAVVLPEGVQRVLPEVPPYPIAITDLRLFDAESRDRMLLDIRGALLEHSFDTARWPLFCVTVSRTAGSRARIHLVIDALIADGHSMSILFREWVALYRGAPALPGLALRYRDYVRALAIETTAPYAAALAYWQARLPSLPPPPDLPLARPPSSIERPRFSHRQVRIDAASWAAFKRRAAGHGVTLSAAVCTAYAEVLAAWSKSSELTLNLLTLSRLPIHPEVSSVIGNFSATTLLEVRRTDGQPFVDQVRRLQHQLWSDLEHGLVSGVRVLRELNRAQHSAGRAGMPVVFASMLNAGDSEASAKPSLVGQLAGLGDDFREVHTSVRTPQVWLDHQVLEDGGELVLNWDAVEELFPPGMITDMFAAYVERLERLAADDSAWLAAPGALVPRPHLERRAAVNATAAPLREAVLHQPFLDQVARDPDRLAVISARRTLRYGELDQLSDRVAHWLATRGARRDRLIAITMEKGWEQIVAAVAVLKAGAAYVPVDPALPTERLHHLLAHAEVGCVLTHRPIDARVSWPPGLERLCVDEADQLPAPTRPVVATSGPGDLAYVIYTSGSTGTPKGVMIEHRAALNTVLDLNERLQVSGEDRVLGLSSLSFDLSVYDIFGMLAAGGALVLPAADEAREPGRWLELVHTSRVTLWNSVPALMEMLVDHCIAHAPRDALPLRAIMLSGDWISLGLASRIPEVAPAALTVSLGGATEASIWSIAHPIDQIKPEWTSIPYGKPLRNQRFDVLDRAMQPRPVWVPGDLYIAGDGLARGYWRDDAKTASSFVTRPGTGERLYRTGDLGRYLPDGTIEFLGREDSQVKVNGYRIELGEIEAALAQQPGVRAAVAAALGQRGHRRLVAYVVPSPGAELSDATILAALATKLPAYAVPQHLMVLDTLPLSGNGKVDRRALPEPGHRPVGRSFTPARSETERALVALWRELLDRAEVGITDNFFELGGQSLLAVRLMGQIRERYGISAPLATLFERPTIEQLAQLIDARTGATTPERSPLVALRASGRRPPLFFVHPVGGDVLCYAELASALGPDQPFFGLQAPDPAPRPAAASDDARPDATAIAAMATSYVAAIRERQPEGPYRIGGWSMGGVVAYEAAQQLRRAGEPVALLAMIDVSMAPSGVRPEMTDLDLLLGFGRDLAGVDRRCFDLDPRVLGRLAPPDRLAEFLSRAQDCGALPREMDLATLTGYFARFRRNYLAMLAYHAVPYDGALMFLRARRHGATAEQARAWGAMCVRAEIIDVDGDHFAIARRDTVARIASLLAAKLPGPLDHTHDIRRDRVR
jgi:amino acid adenylation domain-containing protein